LKTVLEMFNLHAVDVYGRRGSSNARESVVFAIKYFLLRNFDLRFDDNFRFYRVRYQAVLLCRL
jgi:hypothetical protein